MAPLKIFGHRGSPSTHPENTLISFQAAQKAGVHGIELDVQLTKDGMPVVIHDERVDRTTNGIGWVKDFLYDDLIRLDAGHSFSNRYQGTPIPSLEHVLQWISSTSLSLNIELKTGFMPYLGIEDLVMDLLSHYNLEDRTIISSFNHYSVQRVAQKNTNLETAILLMEKLVNPWDYIQNVGANGIHIEWHALDENLIANTKSRGIPIRVFTANDHDHITTVKQLGCEAIFTDYPGPALQLI
ncbi:MAG: glycerophosphodiester phosphodiesterase [Anaerobacillus sp.]